MGAALASTMHSMASADIEGCCGSTLHLGRTCPARLRRRSAVFSHARASHSAFRGWRNAKCWGAPLSAGGRSFAPSSAVVGHKTQTRLGPSVHLFSGRAVERAVGYNASGPVPLHRPPLPLRPVGASLSSKVNRQDKTRALAGLRPELFAILQHPGPWLFNSRFGVRLIDRFGLLDRFS